MDETENETTTATKPQTKTRTRAPVETRPIKLLAVHPEGVFDGEYLHPTGTVFEYYGPGLPPGDVAVQVDDETELGPQDQAPPSKDKPIYSTQGYVDKANRKRGARNKQTRGQGLTS